MNEQELLEFTKCKKDIQYFINKYCFINDPDYGEIPFYLWSCQDELLEQIETSNKHFIILKARQLGISWTLACKALHLANFNRNKKILIISKTEDDAKDFLEKIKFMFDRLPNFLKSQVYERNKTNLWFGQKDKDGKISGINSTITAEASSQSAGRSKSVSLLILDEVAFMQYAREIFKASVPTLKNGKVVAISTANGIGNWFYDKWQEVYKCKDDTFIGVFFSWREHPERDDVWYENMKKILGNAVKIEFPNNPEEAFFQTNEKTFYGDDFDYTKHVAKEQLKHTTDYKIVRGWDFGNTPATLITQINANGQVLILKEIQSYEPGIENHIKKVKELCKEFENIDVIDVADPAGIQKAQTDARSCFEIMRKNGIYPVPGVQKKQIRFETVRRMFREDLILIDKSCELLIKGCLGGYCYKVDKEGHIPDNADPEKNIYSHLQDCLQYIGTKIYNFSKTYKEESEVWESNTKLGVGE